MDDSLIKGHVTGLCTASDLWPSRLPAEEAINEAAPIRPPLHQLFSAVM